MRAQEKRKIAIGSAQFGSPYGISNPGSAPHAQEIKNILERAQSNGIDTIDTAYHYGRSVQALGEAISSQTSWNVVTKPKKLSEAKSLAAVNDSVLSMRTIIGFEFSAILFHSAEELLSKEGKDLARLAEEWKAAGITSSWGVSVYHPSEAADLLKKFSGIELFQFPLSILDQRFVSDAALLAECRARGVKLHARSAFLQGLLLMPPGEAELKVLGSGETVSRVQEAARAAGGSPMQLALSFVFSRPEIDKVIIGANSLGEWEQIWEAPLIDTGDLSHLASKDENLILPYLWGKR